MAPQLRSHRGKRPAIDSSTLGAPKRARKTGKIEENGCEDTGKIEENSCEDTGKIEENDCQDRLSKLPGAVLRHILSFLDTKYAVATSILSRRWQDLFISVPNIILDNYLSRKINSPEADEEFMMFGLRQVMVRHVPHINLFRLKCDIGFEEPVMQTMIKAALWRNVKELDIIMCHSGGIGSLAQEIFKSTSLVVLKLVIRDGDLVVPEVVDLPNLKLLHLAGFAFKSDHSINRLLKGCKFLEDLSIHRCLFWDVKVLKISLPFLRKLSMTLGDHFKSLFLNATLIETKFVLDIPNLEFLEFQDHMPVSLQAKKLIANPRAVFGLPEWENKVNACECINELRGVKSLYLTRAALEAMYPEGSQPSALDATVFETLTLLEMGTYDLRILPSILDCSPHLEMLIVHQHGYDEYEENNVPYTVPETVPVCLTKNLRSVEFRDFDPSEHEFELLKYLLQNGKVLERLKISGIDSRCTPSTRKTIRKKLKRLSSFSETCKVVLDY